MCKIVPRHCRYSLCLSILLRENLLLSPSDGSECQKTEVFWSKKKDKYSGILWINTLPLPYTSLHTVEWWQVYIDNWIIISKKLWNWLLWLWNSQLKFVYRVNEICLFKYYTQDGCAIKTNVNVNGKSGKSKRVEYFKTLNLLFAFQSNCFFNAHKTNNAVWWEQHHSKYTHYTLNIKI